MGHLQTPDAFSLPFHGVTTISARCSREGAVAASERVARQCLRLLTAYAQRGPMNDREMAAFLGLERTTVNARRNELVKRALVMPYGKRKAETGINNTQWGLTQRGGVMAHEGAVEDPTPEPDPEPDPDPAPELDPIPGPDGDSRPLDKD